jgi:hypothetical protein
LGAKKLGIRKMAKDYDQKFVVTVASVIGTAVLLIGLLGIWNAF